MLITGKAVVFNQNNVSTDQIFPGPYVNLTDPKEIAKHVLEGADKTLRGRFKTMGDILITGSNFGCTLRCGFSCHAFSQFASDGS